MEREGQCRFSKEASEWFKEYYESGKLQGEILNKDTKLQHYAGRIKVHAIKQAMLHHYGEVTDSDEISLATLKEGISFLRSAEPNMHKALASKARNEIHEVGMQIVEFLKLKGPHRKLQLLLAFGSMLDKDELDQCLEYLMVLS